jgi:hypothetical protein
VVYWIRISSGVREDRRSFDFVRSLREAHSAQDDRASEIHCGTRKLLFQNRGTNPAGFAYACAWRVAAFARLGFGPGRESIMKNQAIRRFLILFFAGITVALLGACSVSVDDKDQKNGQGKVNIQPPFANLKIDSGEKAADNGIPIYPGAHLRPTENGDSHSANINMGAAGFGLKVIAAEYETNDSPEKVKAFYEEKMKRFGDILVCNGHSGSSDVHMNMKVENTDDKKLSCSDSKGDGWEIKAGTDDDEHLVSIEPHGSGTRFGTVLVQTHGKQDTL